jgi:hypothetical protein
MSAQVDSRAEHILELCRIRAKRKGCRVKKLHDARARHSVITAAAWRLILKSRRFGNIREHIEGIFWHEDSEARNKLISTALNTEHRAYTRATKASGGDPVAYADLKQFAMDSEDAADIEQVIEREGFEAEEIAADDARAKIEAEENERLKQAVTVYRKKLRRTHRDALSLVVGPRLPNGVIADRCGVAERTVAKIRADVCDMADAIFSVPPEEVRLAELERLADIAEAEAKARRAEARQARTQWALSLPAAELAVFKAFAEPLCEELGMSVDELLGASISGPKVAP